MKIIEYIESNAQDINRLLEQCNFFLVLDEDKIIFHLEITPLNRLVNMDGVASIIHTVNLFAGKQDYDSFRQVDFRGLSIVFNRYQQYTIIFGMEEKFDPSEDMMSMKKVVSLLFSIFHEVTSLSKPVTELEIAGSMVTILFVVMGTIGEIKNSSFSRESLMKYTDKLIKSLNESEYQEFRHFSVEEYKDKLSIEMFLEELRKELKDVDAIGFYTVTSGGELKLARTGKLDEKTEKKIIETILDETVIFHRLFEGRKYVSLDLEKYHITFVLLSSFTGLYIVGSDPKNEEECDEHISQFIELINIFFPDEVGEL